MIKANDKWTCADALAWGGEGWIGPIWCSDAGAQAFDPPRPTKPPTTPAPPGSVVLPGGIIWVSQPVPNGTTQSSSAGTSTGALLLILLAAALLMVVL